MNSILSKLFGTILRNQTNNPVSKHPDLASLTIFDAQVQDLISAQGGEETLTPKTKRVSRILQRTLSFVLRSVALSAFRNYRFSASKIFQYVARLLFFGQPEEMFSRRLHRLCRTQLVLALCWLIVFPEKQIGQLPVGVEAFTPVLSSVGGS